MNEKIEKARSSLKKFALRGISFSQSDDAGQCFDLAFDNLVEGIRELVKPQDTPVAPVAVGDVVQIQPGRSWGWRIGTVIEIQIGTNGVRVDFYEDCSWFNLSDVGTHIKVIGHAAWTK